MSRKRYTQAERSEVLERFAASGLSAREFCLREGVNYQNLLRWRRAKAASEDSSGPEPGCDRAVPSGGALFLELDVERPVRPQPDIELEIGAGMVLRIWNRHPAQ